MSKYLEYGWKCNDNEKTVVIKKCYLVKSLFVLKECTKAVFKDFVFSKKYKYNFFINGIKKD